MIRQLLTKSAICSPVWAPTYGVRSTSARPRCIKASSFTSLAAGFLYLAFTFLVYLDVIRTHYGFADDYVYVAASLRSHLPTLVAPVLQGGRPLYALFLWGAFGVVHSISGLSILRALGLVGIAGIAWQLFLHFRRSGMPAAASVILPCIVISMPPFQVYASWAIAAVFPFAALLSGGSSLLIDSASGRSGVAMWRQLFLAVALLIGAAAIYQPAAMYLWAFGSVSLLWRPSRRAMKAFLWKVAVTVIALLTDLLLSRLLPGIFYDGHLAPVARASLSLNPLTKLPWLGQPLLDALNLSNIRPTGAVAVIVGLLCCGAIALAVADLGGSIGLNALLAAELAITFPLSFVPNLAVTQNWPAYRTQVAMSSVVVIYAASCFLFLLRMSGRPRHLAAISTLFAAATTIYFAIVASLHVSTEFVVPQSREWHYATHQVRLIASHPSTTALDAVVTSWSGFAPIARFDEFGVPTSYTSWGASAMSFDAAAQATGYRRAARLHIETSSRPLQGSHIIVLNYPSVADYAVTQ